MARHRNGLIGAGAVLATITACNVLINRGGDEPAPEPQAGADFAHRSIATPVPPKVLKELGTGGNGGKPASQFGVGGMLHGGRHAVGSA